MSYWKPCPKCITGTLRLSEDQWGHFLRCINCGLMSDLPDNCRTPDQVRTELYRLHRQFGGAGTATAADSPLAA